MQAMGRWGRGTVGYLMSTSFITLRLGDSVAKALAAIRAQDERTHEAADDVYVTDDGEHVISARCPSGPWRSRTPPARSRTSTSARSSAPPHDTQERGRPTHGQVRSPRAPRRGLRGRPRRHDRHRRRHRRAHAGDHAGGAAPRRRRAAGSPVLRDDVPDVHPEARRLASRPLLRGVLHPVGAPLLRPGLRSDQGGELLRAPAHLDRRQLRLPVLHADHPRPRGGRGAAARLVADPLPRGGHGLTLGVRGWARSGTCAC